MSTALVTGGSGFIGMHVVKLLLEHGHKVHATVRSLKDPNKCKPLLSLQSVYPDKLVLFEADLMKDGSFLDAMKGCDIVYHVASPFLVPQQIKDGLRECVEPALSGTRNVLQSVDETSSVTRVVLTSSIAAMYGDSVDILKMENSTLSETHWNQTSSATNNPYSYSKVVAERQAWKMCDAQTRWDLVVINPGLVVGPSLSPGSASGSLYMLEAMYQGDNKMGAPELHYPVADVRDVAEAHVKAGENVDAKGRYIVASEQSLSLLDMANYVRPVHRQPKLLPTRNLPKLMVYAAGPFIGVSMKWVSGNIGIGYKVDHSRSVNELGVAYRPLEEVFRAHYLAWADSKSI
ncbi:cinnamoyl-CoA reductase [Aaosphaeria arxii CBS 175.79]|uniref:Cinnamoyl-CoA reductase n=1 Tax=Aaosphaeria arxii CBS 175.79 TaxID=1450172 RepID=A0A6A5XWL5_9PLEO|nr:cinnamoyl-CoA reductase [Aaosphaeria arxii CBS 175.79]KAF2017728.1 cinnamoyl-CoA reductase [Aaosphaeria arxii CBS 175.79]